MARNPPPPPLRPPPKQMTPPRFLPLAQSKLDRGHFAGRGAVRRTLPVTASLLLALAPLASFAASLSWNGTNSNLWSGSNWGANNTFTAGSDLVFSGTATNANRTMTNDISGGAAIGSLSLTSTNGSISYNISGNQIQLSGNISTTGTTSGTSNIFDAIQAPIDLAAGNRVISVGYNHFLTINGVISGSGDLWKNGGNGTNPSNSTLTLNGINTYTGLTTINSGILRINNNSALGSTSNGTVINSTGELLIATASVVTSESLTITGNGASSTSGAIRFNTSSGLGVSGSITLAGNATIQTDTGAGATLSGNVSLGSNTLTLQSGSNTATTTVSGIISGTGALVIQKSSAATAGGFTRLSGANTFSGSTTISQGVLRLDNNLALQNSPLDTSGAGTITVNTAVGTTPTFGGLTGSTALASVMTTNYTSVTGITLNTGSGASLAYSGVIANGAMSITKAGTGAQTLSGANTYSGGTTITDGTLRVGVDSVGSVGSVTSSAIGTGTLTLNGGALSSDGATARTILNAVSVGGDVTLGDSTNTGTLTLNGATNLGGSVRQLTVASDVQIGGNITNGGITKLGSGLLTLSGTNTYSGATTISNGGLKLNGSLANTAVTMAGGTTLSGTGTFGAGTSVTINGTHSPGNSPGVQTFNNLTYNSGAAINWELASNKSSATGVAGTDFDQIVVNGALNFAGATGLNLSFNGAGSTLTWGDSFWSSNQSWVVFSNASAPTGFSNLALNTLNWADSQGTLFSTALPNGSFTIGLNGNDVMLNYSAIPEPSTYAALAGVAALGAVIWRRRRSAKATSAE